MRPHKHAEIIKAWADGADIQVYHIDKWMDVTCPVWLEAYKYRIKPEPKKPPVFRWKWAWEDDGEWYESAYFLTDEEAADYYEGIEVVKLEYSKQEFPS